MTELSATGSAGAPAPRRSVRRRVLRWTVTAALLAFLGFAFSDALSDAWTEIQDENLAFDVRFVVAGLLFAAAVPVSGLLWGRVLGEITGRHIPVLETVSVQCSSWLLKYVPGQVGSVLNKVAWGQHRGLTRTAVLVSFVYENVFLQVASLVPATLVLVTAGGVGVFSDNTERALLPLLLLIPLGALAFGPGLRWALGAATKRILRRDAPAEELALATRRSVVHALWFVLPRIPNAAGFVLITAAVTTVSSDDWLPLGAAYVFGGAIGILAIFVPSGLGVRESVTVLFAREFISTTDAIIASLLARLVSVVADLGVLGVYGATRLVLHRKNQG